MSIPEAIFFKPSSLDGLLSGARKHRSAIFKQAEPASGCPIRERIIGSPPCASKLARESFRDQVERGNPGGFPSAPVLQAPLTRCSGGVRKLEVKIAFLRDAFSVLFISNVQIHRNDAGGLSFCYADNRVCAGHSRVP